MSESEGKLRKQGLSLAFLLAIPTGFLLTTLALVQLAVFIVERRALHSSIAFVAVFFVTCFSFRRVTAPRLRTLVHELKHALVLLVTGNRVTDLQIADDRGHVRYQLEHNRTQFAPFVILAPYFLPLVSFPVFVAGLLFGQEGGLLFPVLLGAAVGIDLQMGIGEIHPGQDDLKRITGGTLMTTSFLLAAHSSWFLLAAVLAIGGRGALFDAGHRIVLQLQPYAEVSTQFHPSTEKQAR